MTDTTQGADAPDDTALFNEAVATDTTLAKFENPPPVTEEPPPAPPEVKPEAKTEPKDETVPPGRLREESEARRRAERERDELRARLEAAYQQQPRQQPNPQGPSPEDIFVDPSKFVQREVAPYLEQMRADMQMQREAMSLDFSLQRHGGETVSAARQALEQGMQRGDPQAWSIYNRAMQSHDPYGVIVRAHQEQETLRNIGGDLDGYRKRILEEALNDPEYRKRVIESAKGQAQATGRTVARPVVASSPSLGNIGAGGGDPQVIEPSDADLFRQATSARRR